MPEALAIEVKVSDMDGVRQLVAAAVEVVNARNAGADCYEAKEEIDALQDALVTLNARLEHRYSLPPSESA